jgi:pimeloyl-ACP methyl ester carboxylesterase
MNNLIQEWFIRLPDTTQDRVMGLLLKSGLFFRMPVFKRHLDAVAFFGADPDELRAALQRGNGVAPSPGELMRRLGAELGFLAGIVDETQTQDLARDLHFRASLYYLLADWFTRDHQLSLEHYLMAMPHFGKYRTLCSPRTEKILLSYSVGTLMAHLRIPRRGTPCPVVVIIQGNSTVKEFMPAFEDLALDRGIATLTVDQPGWGESGLTGNRLRSLGDLHEFASTVGEFLQDRPEIRADAIGVFGVGLGGLLASLSVGLEPRFAAVGSLGAPFHCRQIWRGLPAVQRRMTLRHTGIGLADELDSWFDGLAIKDTLAHVHCPALVVHGNRDESVDVENAFALAAAMRGQVDIKIVENGRHMCTHVLFAWLADYIFDWFSERLLHQPVCTFARGRRVPWELETAFRERSSLALTPID